MNQASASRAARFIAGSLLAAIQIGGRGFCTGRMFMRTLSRRHAEALVGYAFLRPQALDEREILFEPLDPLALGHAEGVELDVAIAQADAEDEIAACR